MYVLLLGQGQDRAQAEMGGTYKHARKSEVGGAARARYTRAHAQATSRARNTHAHADGHAGVCDKATGGATRRDASRPPFAWLPWPNDYKSRCLRVKQRLPML